MLRWLKQIFRGKPQVHERASAPPITDKKPQPFRRGSLPPITLDSPVCPYCGVIQNPPPSRRRKCRDCGEVIHARTDRKNRRKYLLTAEQAVQRDEEEAERKAAEQAEAERLRRKEWDAQWKALNLQVIEASRAGDWHAIQMAHFQQALMLFDRGRDHRDLARASRKAELQQYKERYKEMGVRRVKIMTTGSASCARCAPLEGQSFTIEEALDQMPIPHDDCQTWRGENPYGGWCRCLYQPVIRWD